LAQAGYALLLPADTQSVLRIEVAQLESLSQWWNELPRDEYLRDGGRYRFRRHSCYIQEPASSTQDRASSTRESASSALVAVPRRAHWQSTSYNALHGGLERWFEPIAPEVVGAPVWTRLLISIGALFAQIRPVPRWFIEAHQFRIDTTVGIGRPTPEGAHRDGVDFVALVLIKRQSVRGGETRVFDANGPSGVRFTMREPGSVLLMDDSRVIHETTPIQRDGKAGTRDTLVVTYRAQGFQSP
jgi:hypothetical protein